MNNGYRFKIVGTDRLMTLDQLMLAERHVGQRLVKIIDTKTKDTWTTDYVTVRRKFG